MLRLSFRYFVLTLSFAIVSVGCSRAPETTPPRVSDAEDAKKIETSLAALSPEDRALAEAQKVCPVSGEELGLMGPPILLEVNGRKVFICCDSCRDPMANDPEKYLAKLPAPVESTAPAVPEEN